MALNITGTGSDLSAPLHPRIAVIGVGGAGGNAVNNMIQNSLEGVEFIVANTDAQALAHARTEHRVQLGLSTTQGLGAGARPEIGRAAAEETIDEIKQMIDGANMAFITAGMGGGTGTGAAPVVAQAARELGILTVGVVTKPFQFEGAQRMRLAEAGIESLKDCVDTLIIIPNQNLFRVANEKTTFADAFKMADNVLSSGVRSVTDLMIMPGLINLDFADVRTVMAGMGRAMMGTGEAEGERRALDAAEAAIANPLLEDTCMRGAQGVLINITGGSDITLFEVDEAANRIAEEVEGEANIVFGSCFDEELEGKMRVSVVATGISGEAGQMADPAKTRTSISLHSPVAKPAAAPVAEAPKAKPAAASIEPMADLVKPAKVTLAPAGPTAPQPAASSLDAPAAATPTTPLASAPAAVSEPAPTVEEAPEPAMDEAPAVSAAPEPAQTPTPVTEQPVAEPVRMPEPARPQAAQAAAVAAAVARASGSVAADRVREDAFIPAPPVMPEKAEAPKPQATAPRQAGLPGLGENDRVAPVSKAPEKTEEKPAGKLSLFSRYRAQKKAQEDQPAPSPSARMSLMPAKAAAAEAAPVEDQAAPMPEPQPTHTRSVGAAEDDDLAIPAFLRRQAN